MKDPATDFGENDQESDDSRVTTLCKLMRGSLNVEVRTRQPTQVRKQSLVDLETDKRRSGKWMYMLRKLQMGQKVSESDLKRRARKGIPDSVRGSAWPILAQSDKQIPAQFQKNLLGKQAWMKSLLNQRM